MKKRKHALLPFVRGKKATMIRCGGGAASLGIGVSWLCVVWLRCVVVHHAGTSCLSGFCLTNQPGSILGVGWQEPFYLTPLTLLRPPSFLRLSPPPPPPSLPRLTTLPPYSTCSFLIPPPPFFSYYQLRGRNKPRLFSPYSTSSACHHSIFCPVSSLVNNKG